MPRRLAATSPLVAPQPLLAQLARVSQYDLRLPVVIADLPCHTDALAAERGFGGSELLSITPVHDRGEEGIRGRLPKVQQRRLRLSIGLVFGGRDHAADGRRFPDVTCRILRPHNPRR